MGIPVMIYGQSGSGKSTSLRGFSPEEVCVGECKREAAAIQKQDQDI